MKKTISLFISLLMLLSLFSPLNTFAKTYSGECGENAYYELKDGVLTISGTGKATKSPWRHLTEYKSIKKVIIKNGITLIYKYSFYNCKNLKKVVFPDSLTVIRYGTFMDCKKLEEAKLPENLEVINDSAFKNCTSLKKIILPKSLAVIDSSAFLNCSSATGKIEIPKDAFVDTWAFRNCDKISEVSFENGFYIGADKFDDEDHRAQDECFMDCDGLKTVKIPGSFKVIPVGYFDNCKALDNVQISEGVETIAGFTNCVSLKKIILPESVKVIEGGAFCGCRKLSSVKMQSKLDEIAPRAFHNCPSLEVVLPYGVDKLYDTSMGYTQKEGSDQYNKIKGFKIYGKKCKAITDFCDEYGFKFVDMYNDIDMHNIKNIYINDLTSKTYTGKSIKPKFTVKIADTTLKKDTDYTVKYSNNTKVGTAKVTITGKGKYFRTKTQKFKINPQGTSVKKATSPKAKQLKVTWTKQRTQTTGYQLQVATDSKFTKNIKKVTVSKNKTTTKTITNLKSKKKYYIRIRTYKTVNGTKYYSSWKKYGKTVKV